MAGRLKGGGDPATSKWLRELRAKLKLSQERFAGLIGITVSTVNRWENLHSAPSFLARQRLEAVAKAEKVEMPAWPNGG